MRAYFVIALTTLATASTVDHHQYAGTTSTYGSTTDYSAAAAAPSAAGTTQAEELASVDTRTNRAENIKNHAYPTMHNSPMHDNKLNQARGGLRPGITAKFEALRSGDASYAPARECSAVTCSHDTHQIGPNGPDAEKRWTSVRVTHSCKAKSVMNDSPTKRTLYCQETKCQRGHWCAVEVNGDCSCIERFPYEKIKFCSVQDGPTCTACNAGFTLSGNLCKRHGGWENWGSWSTCTRACDSGTQVRRRSLCNNPEPANGGDTCTGATVEEQNCNTHPCCVPSWTDPGCSPACDNTCTSTMTDGCGNTRSGATYTGEACCVPSWTDPGCSPACGSTCESTMTDGCGNTRPGATYTGKECTPPPAAVVNGGWCTHTSSACDVSCGTGKIRHSRECACPPPSGGGADCSGLDAYGAVEFTTCTLADCPPVTTTTTTPPPAPVVNGGWCAHTSSACDVTCGTGQITHRRDCACPSPSGGGADCSGLDAYGAVEVTTCTLAPCPSGGGGESEGAAGTGGWGHFQGEGMGGQWSNGANEQNANRW